MNRLELLINHDRELDELEETLVLGHEILEDLVQATEDFAAWWKSVPNSPLDSKEEETYRNIHRRLEAMEKLMERKKAKFMNQYGPVIRG